IRRPARQDHQDWPYADQHRVRPLQPAQLVGDSELQPGVQPDGYHGRGRVARPAERPAAAVLEVLGAGRLLSTKLTKETRRSTKDAKNQHKKTQGGGPTGRPPFFPPPVS